MQKNFYIIQAFITKHTQTEKQCHKLSSLEQLLPKAKTYSTNVLTISTIAQFYYVCETFKTCG